MPKYLMKEITQGSEEIMDQELNTADLNDNYQQDIDNTQNEETNVGF